MTFLLGRFWPRATEMGALVGAIASVVVNFIFWFPAAWGGSAVFNAIPFINRMSIVFFTALALAVIVSLLWPARAESNLITMRGVSVGATSGFDIGLIVLILIALYATWW